MCKKKYFFIRSNDLLIFILFYLLSLKLHAATKVELNDSIKNYSIGKSLFILEDVNAAFSIEDIIARDSSFVLSLMGTPSFGITHSAYWYRLDLKNNSSILKWYLEIGSPFIYEIDLYLRTPDGSFQKKSLGTNTGFEKREIKSNQIIYPFNILPGSSKQYYFRVKSRNFLHTKLQVATMQYLYESNQKKDVFNGIYFGLLIALMSYNFFVFISLKDWTYLYYVLYTLFLGFYIVCEKGYGLEFLGPNAFWFYNTNLDATLAIFFGALFANSFLQAKFYVPNIYKFNWTIFLVLLFVLLLSFFGFFLEGAALIAFNPAYVYYVFILAVAVYRKGFKPAVYFIFGFGILMVEVLLYNLNAYGLFPENLFTDHSLEIGSAIESIILSFALANKLQFYKKEKDRIQMQALNQSTQFSQQLIQSQEIERKKIAGELQDSIGQSLILIKNRVLSYKKDKTIDKIKPPIHELAKIVADTIQEVRKISYGLRPYQLDLLGLSQSIQTLVEEVGETSHIKFTVNIGNIDGLFYKDEEINIYRIIQEYLNSIVKLSGMQEASIVIEVHPPLIEIIIEDYGKDFLNTPESNLHNKVFDGLFSLQERINILGGTLNREFFFPNGTRVKIRLPISDNHKLQ